jgi:hypothetical protein
MSCYELNSNFVIECLILVRWFPLGEIHQQIVKSWLSSTPGGGVVPGAASSVGGERKIGLDVVIQSSVASRLVSYGEYAFGRSTDF